jgi:PleD family two-component response regulator
MMYSAGLALLVPSHPVTLDQLMARADAALYQAKHGGRGRMVPGRPPPSLQPSRAPRD